MSSTMIFLTLSLSVCVVLVSVCQSLQLTEWIQSPGFPHGYTSNGSLTWRYCAPPGRVLTLTLLHLDLEKSSECENDALKISEDHNLLANLCGRITLEELQSAVNPSLRSSSGGCLSVTFRSDTSNTEKHAGFIAFFTIKGVTCGLPELPDLMVLTEEKSPTSKEHKIRVKCASEFYNLVGNAVFTCDATGEWVAENGQSFAQHTPQCVPVCGVTKESAGGRIFGGDKAKLGQIPWQLLVKEPNRGGASLINDRWAVTAAHVVENQKSLKFTGGMVDAQDNKMVEMETEKIIIHPSFKSPNYDNDIALVKMSSRVPLSENIRPVCLPETKTRGPVLEGKSGTVSGFGATSDKRMRSQFLQYGHVKEYSGSCFQTDQVVTANMFCAGDADGGVDSCKGDGGGPLVIPMLGFGSPDTPYRLKGIVSWGPPVCGNQNYKSYYTKVENYLDWIRETMEKN